jgi:hypothetical protein
VILEKLGPIRVPQRGGPYFLAFTLDTSLPHASQPSRSDLENSSCSIRTGGVLEGVRTRSWLAR